MGAVRREDPIGHVIYDYRQAAADGIGGKLGVLLQMLTFDRTGYN